MRIFKRGAILFLAPLATISLLIAGDEGKAVPEIAAAPPGGALLVSEADYPQFKVWGKDAKDSPFQIVDVEGMPFKKAMRIEVVKNPEQLWDVQLVAVPSVALKPGDAMLLRFWMRTLSSAHESGEGAVMATLSQNKTPFAKYLKSRYGAGRGWTHFDVPFTMRQGEGEGQWHFGFYAGVRRQQVEIGGVELLDYGPSVSVDSLPKTMITYKGREEGAPWREAAARRIEELRKADVSLLVKDASGKPVPGAKVEAKLLRHAFNFGSAINVHLFTAKPSENPNAECYRAEVFRLFNCVVPENHMKWRRWHDKASLARCDEFVDMCASKGLRIRGHCVVWPGWGFLPKSLEELKGDPAKLRAAVDGHIAEAMARYKGRLIEWDVVNEAVSNRALQGILGEDCVSGWFKLAHSSDPSCKLFINDYSILTSGDAAETKHQSEYKRIIKSLIDSGAPLDGIGMQGHFGGTPTPPEDLLKILDEFAKFGKAIEVTEYDNCFRDDALSGDYMRDLLTVLFSHPSVSGFLVWGFWDGSHWQDDSAVFKKDWTLKPSGKAYEDLVFKKWTTEASGETGADGVFKFRGFEGEYRVKVESAGAVSESNAKLGKASPSASVAADGK